jgi:SAM-dependent methyltransferase
MSEGLSPPNATILETVADYYAGRLQRFGTTPQGVDWSSADSQRLRFERLLQVAEDPGDASLNDWGCGYGALVDYLAATGRRFSYCGFDVCEPMIHAARARHAGVARCSFTRQQTELTPADYTIASGIFNVKLAHADDEWHDYVVHTLTAMAALSSRAFAFNMLTTYSDPPKRRSDLFYADPMRMFDLCRRRFSSRVALLHDYPLYEFTIVVRM